MSKVIENYVLKEVVGSGQYGKVFRSSHQKTGKIFAVKVIKIEKFKSVPKLHEFTNNEIQTLTKLRNPNVISFVEMLRTTNNVYLVYDFCNGGTLEDIIKKKKFLSEKEAIVIFSQILNAFKSLFKENILHRDLKPSNILLHDGVIKVADFGFCKTMMSESDLTQTMVGSPIYMAPEVLKGCNYNIKADIWSMGVVLFEMLFGFCPYEDKTIVRLIGQIDNKILQIPKHINPISSKLEELLLRMLTVDPIRRIDWNSLLNYSIVEKQTPLGPSSLNNLSINTIQQTQQIPQQGLQMRAHNNVVQQIPYQGSQQPETQSQPQMTGKDVHEKFEGNRKPANFESPSADLKSGHKVNDISNFLTARNRILYQVKALNNVLEINDAELAPILSFLMMKNISNQTEYLRTQLNATCLQMLQENQQRVQFGEILQNEIDFIQGSLVCFKQEIDNLIENNSYFSNNTALVREKNTIGIDFEYYKTILISYIENLRNKFSLFEHQTQFIQLSMEQAKSHLLKYLQHLNEILNSFLLDEYFSNQLDSRFNDFDKSFRIAEYSSLLPIVLYKIEVVKNKCKPKDKMYLYI